ncbi:APC family permease [Arthrobacter cheniae]|uniref:APC family permease n=1 Tax=Arthrobacter cheniae TaxID=1258888 RepID=A0A3A5MA26_9MICC|nr:APC family permease [Arthrobacter cheniae]RJT79111.1 APC family permease [Arthrobacter cheniae]
MSHQPRLRRAMGRVDATMVGVGAMIGAGAFVVFAPAAAAAGHLLPLAVVIAGFVAYCNASATASLAIRYPSSGGTYVYGREQLGHWPGFLAGWGFITGKLASCAAMALTFGLYAAPGAEKAAAVAAVAALTIINLFGVTRTALATRVIVSLVVPVLAFVIVVAFSAPADQGEAVAAQVAAGGVFQAAGLMFFAFAGYARIATMGEEVRDPRRTIPVAVFGALGFTLLLYVLLALSLLHALGPAGLAGSTAPLRDAIDAAVPGEGSTGRGGAVVTIAAALACLGALLALIAGVGRTSLAMGRGRDLPRVLTRISTRYSVPWVADIATAVVVAVLLLTTDVLTVVGFSSFGVLLYYAIANVAAFTLAERQWYAPRWLNAVGAVACLVLAFTLPAMSVLTMTAVLAVGLIARAIVLAGRRRRA